MKDSDLDEGSDGHGTGEETVATGPGERAETSLGAADTSVRATSAKTSRQGGAKTSRHGIVNLFVVAHIVGIGLWVFPINDSLTRVVRKTIGPYFSSIGLQQEWSLFAPDPLAANSYVDGEVVLENGEVRTWNFPRLESMDFTERYGKARYRKFAGWIYRRNYEYAWADAARYAARQFRGADSRPRTVKLIRHWERIPPMLPGVRPAALQTWHSIVFFVYQVPPDETK